MDSHRQHLKRLVKTRKLEHLVLQKDQELQLGLLLFDLRTKAKLTQQELAKRAGVQQAQVSRWEQEGIPSTTQLATLVRLFGALGRTFTLSFSASQSPIVKMAKERPRRKEVTNKSETSSKKV